MEEHLHLVRVTQLVSVSELTPKQITVSTTASYVLEPSTMLEVGEYLP